MKTLKLVTDSYQVCVTLAGLMAAGLQAGANVWLSFGCGLVAVAVCLREMTGGRP